MKYILSLLLLFGGYSILSAQSDLAAQNQNDVWGQVSYEDPLDIAFEANSHTWKFLFYLSPEIVTQPLTKEAVPYLCGPAGWNDTGKMPQGVFVKTDNGEIKPVDSFLEANAIYFQISDSFFVFRTTKFAVCFSSDKVPFSFLYVLPSPLTVEWEKPGVAYKATFLSSGTLKFPEEK
jgi:hypothetical protein